MYIYLKSLTLVHPQLPNLHSNQVDRLMIHLHQFNATLERKYKKEWKTTKLPITYHPNTTQARPPTRSFYWDDLKLASQQYTSNTFFLCIRPFQDESCCTSLKEHFHY